MHLLLPNKAASHKATVASLHVCADKGGGKKGPSGQLMTDYFLQLLKKNLPTAQPWEMLRRWDTGWGVVAGG